MKIINRSDFMKLPKNTLFTTYDPCYFGHLTIKGDTLPHNDWYEQQIVDAVDANNSGELVLKLDRATETGESLRFDFECEMRNGMFDDNQLFAVWDEEDVLALINRLQKCVNKRPHST